MDFEIFIDKSIEMSSKEFCEFWNNADETQSIGTAIIEDYDNEVNSYSIDSILFDGTTVIISTIALNITSQLVYNKIKKIFQKKDKKTNIDVKVIKIDRTIKEEIIIIKK